MTREWIDDLINAREAYTQKCNDIVYSGFATNEILIYSEKILRAISKVLESPLYYKEYTMDNSDVTGMYCVEYRGYVFFTWLY